MSSSVVKADRGDVFLIQRNRQQLGISPLLKCKETTQELHDEPNHKQKNRVFSLAHHGMTYFHYIRKIQ